MDVRLMLLGALSACTLAATACHSAAPVPPTPAPPTWHTEAGAASCPPPPRSDAGLPTLVISARPDATWLDMVRALDQCRAAYAAGRYVLEVSGSPPRATRELTIPRAGAAAPAPPAAGEPVRADAPRWVPFELTRVGQLFVGGQLVDSDAALDSTLRGLGGAPLHAVVSADAGAPPSRVIELLTKLQARGLDPSIAVSRSDPR